MRKSPKTDPKTLDEALALLTPGDESIYQWCAGFVEADGCIHVGKSGGRNMKEHPLERFHTLLVVVQKDPRPVRLLQSLFGGQIKKVYRHKNLVYNQWIICANRAYAALALLHPWLRFKREQAELAMAL